MEERIKNAEQESSVVCPNCGCETMEEVTETAATMDALEWFSFLSATTAGSLLAALAGQMLISRFPEPYEAPVVLNLMFLGMIVLAVGSGAFWLVTELSVERYRHDRICVWYVRCSKCHCRYRIVRPLGTVPAWEEPTEQEENGEDEQEQEPDPDQP